MSSSWCSSASVLGFCPISSVAQLASAFGCYYHSIVTERLVVRAHPEEFLFALSVISTTMGLLALMSVRVGRLCYVLLSPVEFGDLPYREETRAYVDPRERSSGHFILETRMREATDVCSCIYEDMYYSVLRRQMKGFTLSRLFVYESGRTRRESWKLMELRHLLLAARARNAGRFVYTLATAVVGQRTVWRNDRRAW